MKEDSYEDPSQKVTFAEHPQERCHVPVQKINQLQYETDTWKRLLGFIMEENILLKNRLSDVLKDTVDRHFLEEAEHFQSCFIKEDELVGLLKNDITELDKLLTMKKTADRNVIREIMQKLARLRRNLANVETQFSRLKLGFNSYLSENISM